MSQFTPVFGSLWRIFVEVAGLLQNVLYLALDHVLLIAWIAWWLFAVNWDQAWRYLAKGAWAPIALIMLITALVWSRMEPRTYDIFGVSIANFWWQLGVVAFIAALTLICGWLQGLLRWAPAEIDLNPPAPAAHHHGHH